MPANLLECCKYGSLSRSNNTSYNVKVLDLEKAFDKVPHRRLISKLHSYQVNNEIILWIESFLIGRKQRVKIDEVMSEWSDVLSGIPQGSILGPVCSLFTLMT